MSEWKSVGASRYEVSDLGVVRNATTGHALSQSERRGYLAVSLQIDGRSQRRSVHHLVLEAFCGPRPAGMHGCHNDGNRRNNCASNLRWDTPQANIHDSIKHGTQAKTRVTHCPAGHAYDAENTIRRNVRGRIHRACLQCRREYGRRRYQRRVKPNHCRNGHEFTPENTYVRPDGMGRLCRECTAKRHRRYKERNVGAI